MHPMTKTAQPSKQEQKNLNGEDQRNKKEHRFQNGVAVHGHFGAVERNFLRLDGGAEPKPVNSVVV